MRKMKSILAFVLVLVMVFSCIGSAAAMKPTASKDGTKVGQTQTTEGFLKGFQSAKFKELNSYQYADDEIVRAIVVMESAPEADVAENGSEKAAAYRVKLVNEHNTVRKAMKFEYTMGYEFTALLNGFSCDVAYGNLEKIAAIDGVKAVYIANHYDVPETEPAMDSANAMTYNSLMHVLGYGGEGTVIAVLDTGTRLSHEAFQIYDESLLGDVALTEADLEKVETEGVYVSKKIPFAYDYADLDNDVTDMQGHGTHVAGIAAGYVATTEGEVTFSGAAPYAQLLAMKIFSDVGGGTNSDIYFYALEDAYRLGADVVNMSIGAQNGFTYDAELETEVFGNIYQRMSDAGIVLCIAAGNEGSMADYASNVHGYTGAVDPSYQDYGVVGTPSTYRGTVSVASMENAAFPQFLLTAGEASVAYSDTSIGEFTDAPDGLWQKTFGGQTTPIVTGLGIGTEADYEGKDVTGKIAVVSRGETSFEEKVEMAAKKGAVGCIVVNNVAGIINMAIETYEVPAISVQLDAMDALTAVTEITTEAGLTMSDNPEGGEMSSFSSWGTTPELTLKPAITSIGGDVYSSVNTGDSSYEVYSGTSMATPNAAGTFANLLSLLKLSDEESGITRTKAERAELAKDLMESTAEIVFDSEGYAYSPRKQGAGLATALASYLTYSTTGYIANPLQELGDDPTKTGVFEFDVELVNDFGSTDALYQIAEVAMYDYIYVDEDGLKLDTLSSDYFGEDAVFTYSVNDIALTADELGVVTVPVPKDSKVTVHVKIALSDTAKAMLDETFPNGSFVEGYVEFYDETANTAVHSTYLGFYGDWTKAPVLEEADFGDVLEAEYILNTTVVDGDGNTAADYGYTYNNLIEAVTEPNMAYLTSLDLSSAFYAGGSMIGYFPFREDHVALATSLSNADYRYTEQLYVTPYQLRNAKHLVMTVSNAATGEVYYTDDTPYLPKAVYDTDYMMWQNTGVFTWDGTDAEGNCLPDGTVAHVRFDATLPYRDAEQNDVWSFDVVIDNKAPVLEKVVNDPTAETLTVTASDNHYLQCIYLADYDTGSIIELEAIDTEKAGDSYTATFDVSGTDISGGVYIGTLDYATNENTYICLPTLADGNSYNVTYTTPAGSETVAVPNGVAFAAANCTEAYENYEFVGWVEEPCDKAESYNADGVYFPGDLILFDGDVTLYALYANGKYVTEETYSYTMPMEVYEDFEGTWALIGFNFDYESDEGTWLEDDPIALSSSLTPVSLVNELGAVNDGENYVIYCAINSFAFTFEKLENGNYTVKNVGSGKYLNVDAEGNISLSDKADEFVVINDDWGYPCLYSATYTNLALIYDDEYAEFYAYDNTVDVSGGFGYVATDLYPVYFYEQEFTTLTTFETDYYTTVIGGTDEPTEEPTVKPVDPIEPSVEPTEPTVEPTEPSVEPTEPSVEPTEPSVEPTEPSVEPTEPSVEPTEPTEPSKPCDGGDDCVGKEFSDMPAASDWAHEGIDYAIKNELMNGMGNGKFEPETSMTRAMLVTVLWRNAGSPKAGKNTFTDVKDGEWYTEAITWAAENGIVKGMGNNTFEPDTEITREQMATILYRYANLLKVDTSARDDLKSFKDAADVSDWAKEAVQWAVAAGVINGSKEADATYLFPQENATRAQVAAMLMRYIESVIG